MAERRMFAKTIIDSDAFLDMPLSTQALYFHLSMRADDEGFINNHKKIARMVGASDDEVKVLIAKNFIIAFESGVIVIKHWKLHNYIRGDRLRTTNYCDERASLDVKNNGTYTVLNVCQSDVSQMSDDCQHRIGKDRIGEVSIGKDIVCKEFSFSLSRQSCLSNTSKEYQARLKEYIDSSNKPMSYEDFYTQCEMKPYKYKNFKMAYDTWNKNAQTRQPPKSFKQQDDEIKDHKLNTFLAAREQGFDLRNISSEDDVQDAEVIEG